MSEEEEVIEEEEEGQEFLFKVPSPITYRMVNRAARILEVDTDKVLENPAEVLDGMQVPLSKAVPFIEAVTEDADLSALHDLSPDDLQYVLNTLVGDFFLCAYLEAYGKRMSDTNTLLEELEAQPEATTVPKSLLKGRWRVNRSSNTNGCSTLRLKTS